MADRLMLLDGPSLWFRAFFGVPESITGPDGTPVNAIRGFLDMLAHLLRERRPDRLAVCLDLDWRPAFRVEALASYKAHRVADDGGDQTPDPLAEQVPVIEEVLDAIGIARVGVEGYEADDVIGSMATRHPGPVDVVTGDRDLFQLVRDDKPVRVLYTGRGVRRLEAIDEAAVASRYGIPGRAYADFAILRGDPSDGLPGVPGVGEKTAAGLITRYQTIEDLLAAPDAPGKVLAARDYIDRAITVVRVATDLPLPDGECPVPREPRDPERVVELSDRWGLDSPLGRLLGALTVQA